MPNFVWSRTKKCYSSEPVSGYDLKTQTNKISASYQKKINSFQLRLKNDDTNQWNSKPLHRSSCTKRTRNTKFLYNDMKQFITLQNVK